jgi:hypothetical protein
MKKKLVLCYKQTTADNNYPGPNLKTLGKKPLYNDATLYNSISQMIFLQCYSLHLYPSSLATVAKAGKVQLYFLGPTPA